MQKQRLIKLLVILPLALLLCLQILLPTGTEVTAETVSPQSEEAKPDALGPIISVDTSEDLHPRPVNAKCGDDLYATLSGDKLTITGSGAMYDYRGTRTPWYYYRSEICSLSLPSKMTSIGRDGFEYCRNLKNVQLPSGLRTIDSGGFFNCSSLQSIELPSGLERICSVAFTYCSSLREIVFRSPDTLVQINNGYISSDTSENLSLRYTTGYLGNNPDAVVYGKHSDARETAKPQTISGSIAYFNYAEAYAKKAGYTFYATNVFSDVAEGKYYEIPVAWAYGRKITGGVSATKFGPGKDCTRAQIMTFLWKAAGSPEPKSTSCPFTDVPKDKYYYKAILWAVENKITGGVSATKFGVNKPCTRAQTMTFLWKAAGSPEPKSSSCPFTDVPKDKYYYKAILWAVENGITGGVGGGKFGVGKTCTRAQVVTFLYKAEKAAW